jgi:hypothetical protein
MEYTEYRLIKIGVATEYRRNKTGIWGGWGKIVSEQVRINKLQDRNTNGLRIRTGVTGPLQMNLATFLDSQLNNILGSL